MTQESADDGPMPGRETSHAVPPRLSSLGVALLSDGT
jgi:hypothetical protein